MTLQSQPIANLIQGVSQQAAQQRRDAQCEEQFDCINSPKNGAVARNGAEFIAYHDGLDLTDCFPYELFRGADEHYLVAISGGDAYVFNLETGAACPVTINGSYAGYLDTVIAGRDDKDNYAVQTVGDHTFIANKSVKPVMAAGLSSTRNAEALVFFRAGGYSITYALTIVYGGVSHTWTYKTPDNSAPDNASWITTAQIAATFKRALTGAVASGGYTGGVGGVYDGDPGSSGTGTTSVLTNPGTLTALFGAGFGVELNGNLLRIYRSDANDFTIDSADGVGDTHVNAFKDSVRSFSELPKGGFSGMVFRVKGRKGEQVDDYWVEYSSTGSAAGFWRERVAPGVKTGLDAATMPHALVNTALNTFELKPLTWSSRIAGDGTVTAKDPGFVGQYPEDIFYHQNRLALLTEGTCDWSKARNVFTHFPDTVQTVLADAPIGITLAAGRTIALLRRALLVDESLFLWAQRVQYRVHSGQETFKQDTIESPVSMAYEFAEKSEFGPVASSVYFATEPEDYASVRNLVFSQGRSRGDTDVTAHVAEYIPAGVRRLPVSDTGQMLFVQTDGAPNSLFLYNYLVQGEEVVQSAWNKWRLPAGTILWCSVYRLYLYVALQRTEGLLLLRVPLDTRAVDPGTGTYEGVVGPHKYRTRMDLRASEADCSISYNATTAQTTITLPFPLEDGEEDSVRVALRTAGTLARGRLFTVVSAVGDTVVVSGNLTGYEFYVGLAISSERKESTFYLRGPSGLVPAETITVRNVVVNHDRTGYYRIEVDQGLGRTKRYDLGTTTIGSGSGSVGGSPAVVAGQLVAAVESLNEECSVTLVNDSILPSAWQTAEVQYEAKFGAKPRGTRTAAA